ncbi:ffab7f62-df45-4e7d-9dad-d336490b7164-CDS [Sclerotinia trifoliorum]|uniref:Ffab7f62-df45-4e7d-9dad-d336490b7164-CDS n=1 Tax=Sclerotinia trifoliorum TaxID=28548 RepID=A0A8H2W1V8_9HELO|nr:ffab7f62-df45-4e7d-9dad-d336490b7164-CDS [Sclerotinia trifoliorum]
MSELKSGSESESGSQTEGSTEITGGSEVKRRCEIENFKSIDPFAEAGKVDLKQNNQVHLRCQQTGGRPKLTKEGKKKPHMLTTVQGLPEIFDMKKVVKFFKKKFACACCIVDDKVFGKVIQIQGDYKEEIFNFLTTKEGLGLSEETIVIHG